MDGATHEYFSPLGVATNSSRRWLITAATALNLFAGSFHSKKFSEDYKSLMMNSNLGDLDATENYYGYNDTIDSYEYKEEIPPFALGWIALIGITLIICCFGFVGNGYIIWLLGFQMKRNCFTPFIFNLAIADFGFLASVVIYYIHIFTYFLGHGILNIFCASFSHMMYINSYFLLTAISIDRCVAVLFPIWHRCSRPKHLSLAVCAFLWTSSFLLVGIVNFMKLSEVIVDYSLFGLLFLVIAVLCLPLITLSTVVLFVKVCLKSNQKNQGRILMMILITLLCFLTLAFPLSVFVVIANFFSIEIDPGLQYWETGIILISCLSSSMNPVIYFLVGRKKGSQSKESMKVILQKVFKETEVVK